jgi:transposase
MRYAASEKLEIIRTVETSHLPVRRTLDKIAIPKTTFYAWQDRYAAGGFDALEDRKPRPKRVWNRISDEVRNKVIERALEELELSPREVAVAFTDAEKTFVSEASVYRILKAEGLVTSPAFIVMKAADAFANPTTAINQRRVEDAPSARSDRLHLLEGHRLGLVLSLDRPRRLLALHRRLEAVHDHDPTVGALFLCISRRHGGSEDVGECEHPRDRRSGRQVYVELPLFALQNAL